MCSWAFELLRTQPSCIGTDSRGFHERFKLAWGRQLGRCRDGRLPCMGQGLRYCQRFVGLEIQDQSAHDKGCNGKCCRLLWNKASYLKVKTTRAVSINRTNARGGTQYCPVSTRTLAISHVWSHSQGGRPEEESMNAYIRGMP